MVNCHCNCISKGTTFASKQNASWTRTRSIKLVFSAVFLVAISSVGVKAQLENKNNDTELRSPKDVSAILANLYQACADGAPLNANFYEKDSLLKYFGASNIVKSIPTNGQFDFMVNSNDFDMIEHNKENTSNIPVIYFFSGFKVVTPNKSRSFMSITINFYRPSIASVEAIFGNDHMPTIIESYRHFSSPENIGDGRAFYYLLDNKKSSCKIVFILDHSAKIKRIEAAEEGE